ncbi:hypothetical protein [Catellatospora methionotrophica]|nr:hypothetical protein [Catellatospora methionotrophica]
MDHVEDLVQAAQTTTGRPVPLELVSATGFRSGFAELVCRPA